MTAIEKLAQGDACTWATLLAYLEPEIEGALHRLNSAKEDKDLAHSAIVLGVINAFNRTIREEEQSLQQYISSIAVGVKAV